MVCLGEYDGAGAIERAYHDFQAGKSTRTGLMIHYVVLEVDRGDPILIQEVTMKEGETLDELTKRMHANEHPLLVKATAKVAQELSATKSI